MSFAEGPEIWGVNIFNIFGIGAVIGGSLVLLAIMRDKTWKKSLGE